MKNYIEIKNFGPIKHIKYEVKNINILIGTTASGKSTVAKLICIFHERNLLSDFTEERFRGLLREYNIDFVLQRDTQIIYNISGYKYLIKGEDFRRPVRLEKVFNFLSDYEKTILQSQDYTDSFFTFDTTKNWRSIRKEIEKILSGDLEDFNKFNEKFDNRPNTDIHGLSLLIHQNLLFKVASQLQRKLSHPKPLYIPAERIITPMIMNGIMGFLDNEVSVPKCITNFGREFEVARKAVQEYNLDFLNVTFKHENGRDYIMHDDGTSVELSESSSGIQSILPMLLVLYNRLNEYQNRLVAIEEPELSLFPSTQRQLLMEVIWRSKFLGHKLIITTHSPYILTVLDNFIQAKNAAKIKPNFTDEINSVIPQGLWLDYEEVSSSYFEAGEANSTLDEEYQSIGADKIDDVSDDIGATFDALLKIKYDNA